MSWKRWLLVLIVSVTGVSTLRAQSGVSPLAQSTPNSQRVNKATSETYRETLTMIRAWFVGDDRAQLSRLFSTGESRRADLVAACHSSDRKISNGAFLILQLLGKSESAACAAFLSRKYKQFLLAHTGELGDADFENIEGWFAKRRSPNGYKCGGDFEALSLEDDSTAYALILDGSSRAKSILHDMLAFERSCKERSPMLDELLEASESLIDAANSIDRNLRFEPDTFKTVIQASAFFLPAKYRKESGVEIIARNETTDRMLLEVSYICGLQCGAGYYVVLHKDGSEWRYALITMAWIS
jgi:hypothetical protein